MCFRGLVCNLVSPLPLRQITVNDISSHAR